MSGYLMRMAASARNPGGAIRPMLGSVHSPEPFYTGSEDVPAPDMVTRAANARSPDEPVRPIPQSAFTPERQISRAAPQPDLAPDVATSEPDAPTRPTIPPMASEPALGHIYSEPARVDRRSFQPLMSQTPRSEPPTVDSPAAEFERPALSATLASILPKQSPNAEQDSEVAAAPETFVIQVEQQNAQDVVYRDRYYQPLMAEVTAKTDATFAKPLATPFATSFARRVSKAEKKEFSRRETTPEPQPDEIEIHIGRIEVVAVPPAPARAETKPIDKSPNLGDYLKLRHGRFR